MNKDQIIRSIVLTGGPCAGKTTALASIKEWIEQLGWKVIIVPESATTVIGAGFMPGDVFARYQFQKLIAQVTLSMEQIMKQAARALQTDKVLLLHDRGMMDSKAYMNEGEFGKLMHEFGATSVTWRDMPYGAVIHMKTAAYGAEKHYTLSNNSARTEGIDLARKLDDRTLEAWVGHPHLRVLDNSTDFAGKLARLRSEVAGFLGIPVPLEIERKFVISPLDLDTIPVKTVTVEIEQLYLVGEPGVETRIRRRGIDGSYAYFRTIKKPVGDGTRAEIEEQIDEREYEFSLRYRLPGTKVIKKTRTCFVWDNQYIEVDQIPDCDNLWVMEIELTDRQQEISTPPFVHIEEEVTGVREYSNAALAGCT